MRTLPTSVLDRLFNTRALAQLLRRDHVLCIGDSHVEVMRHVRLPGVWFRAKPLVGATASGVLNPSSKTGSLERFTAQLDRAKSWQQMVLQLGEVDCGFLIWRRADRLGLSVEGQLEQTLDSYATFIATVADRQFARVIVLSVPLPTIRDYPSALGEVANLRKTVTASQAERTQLTLRFNAELRKRCEQIGVVFVDVTSGHLDLGTGLIDRRFVRVTERDHHLADDPYAELIVAQLRVLWPRAGRG